MKKTKRLIAWVLTLAMMLSVVSFSQDTSAAKKKVAISKKTASIQVGASITLKMKNTKKKVTWSSSKPKVASVSKKGKVTGKKAGTAIIKAKVAGKKYSCKVTVTAKKEQTTNNATTQQNPSSTATTQTNPSSTTTTQQENTTENNNSGIGTKPVDTTLYTVKGKISGDFDLDLLSECDYNQITILTEVSNTNVGFRYDTITIAEDGTFETKLPAGSYCFQHNFKAMHKNVEVKAGEQIVVDFNYHEQAATVMNLPSDLQELRAYVNQEGAPAAYAVEGIAAVDVAGIETYPFYTLTDETYHIYLKDSFGSKYYLWEDFMAGATLPNKTLPKDFSYTQASITFSNVEFEPGNLNSLFINVAKPGASDSDIIITGRDKTALVTSFEDGVFEAFTLRTNPRTEYGTITVANGTITYKPISK